MSSNKAFPDRIGVVPRDFLQEALTKRPGNATVICCERNVANLPALCKNLLHLAFDDITNEWFQQQRHHPQVKNMIPPQHQHVEQALEFARLHVNRIIFVCCHAGINRSPGIAWAILLDRTHDIKLATEKLFHVAPFSAPNRDVVRMALELVFNSTEQFEKADQLLKSYEEKPSAEDSWITTTSTTS